LRYWDADAPVTRVEVGSVVSIAQIAAVCMYMEAEIAVDLVRFGRRKPVSHCHGKGRTGVPDRLSVHGASEIRIRASH
jgi:hypothetical protein